MTTSAPVLKGLRVGIVGGSICGQLIAIKLLKLGADVSVFEKSSSSSFKDRGVGIGCPSPVVEVLKQEELFHGDLKSLHCPALNRVVPSSESQHTGRIVFPQPVQLEMFSWAEIFHQFSRSIPPNLISYNCKVESVGMNSNGDKPFLKLATEENVREFDLLVGCDGYLSTVRPYVSPSSRIDYAGYVLWRGFLTSRELEKHNIDIDFFDRFYFVHLPTGGGHLVTYFVLRPDGEKVLTWGFYTVVPPDHLGEVLTDRSGKKHEHSIAAGHLSAVVEENWKAMALEQLPLKFSKAICATENTFVQGIFDMDLPSLTKGKIALAGIYIIVQISSN